MALLDGILLLGLVIGFAFFQTPILLWTIGIGCILVLFSLFSTLGIFFLTLCWLLFLAAAAFANLKQLRIRYFTQPIATKLQRQMPAISDTEREAIEAGNVWWEKDLFCGRPQWKNFLAIPQPKLTSEEQQFLDNQVETLCSMLNDWEIVTIEKNLPKNVWDYLKKERFFGMIIPKEYGGLGFSALAHSTIVVKIATRSVSAAVNTMVPNSLGPAELLLHYGTDEQKNYYLPRLAKGEEIPCFALTGPEAGSDAGSITDTGIICHGEFEGQRILGIKLHWDKRYITLAPIATVLGVAFRLYDPDHLLGDKPELGITLCLIPTSHPGVEIGTRHLPMYLAFMNGPTRGKDVFIPLDWIIGGTAMAGKGWRMLMECLSIGRSISLPALSTAAGKFSYRYTGAYSKIRKQFNTSIAHFGGIEEALGNIAGNTYLLEANRVMIAGAVDQKIKPAIASAIAKYNMTEMARAIVSHAMDIHAGQAIQVGPRNFIAHGHLAIPISITVEGANILTRNLIIFGQGAIRCHPYILQEIELLNEKDSPEKFQKFDRLLLSHMGYIISNLVRNVCYGITGGRLILSPVKGAAARYFKQLTRMSAALALLADVTMMLLGGALKRKERISARLGDILSQLYLASAVLKYFHDHQEPKSDISHLQWAVEECLQRIQNACDELLNNFPIRWLGKILRWMIFPFGTAYYKPQDKLYHEVVKNMLVPSEFRDRLTQYVYIGKSHMDATHRLDQALSKVLYIEPIAKKFQTEVRKGNISRLLSFDDQLNTAVNNQVLSQEEADKLYEFEMLYKEIIKVDEFSFDLNTVINFVNAIPE